MTSGEPADTQRSLPRGPDAAPRAAEHWLSESRIVRFGKGIVIAFVLAALASFLMMRDTMLAPNRGFGGDFLAVYAAGTLAREGEPARAYDLASIVATERRVLPQATYTLIWPYPPVFQMVALPLASLPYAVAYALWAVLLLAIYIFTWRYAFGGAGAAFWAAMSATGVYVNVMHGQNGLLNASLVGLSLLTLQSRPLLAGLLLGVLCYKPQIGLPLGILLLATGQWRAVLGAALSVAALCAASAAVLGLDVWRAFIASSGATQAVLDNPTLPLGKLGTVFSLARLPGVPSMAAHILQGVVAIAALAIVIHAWRGEGERIAKLALAAAMVPLVPPYLFDYDFVILVLPIGLLLADGFRNGWLPWTRSILLLAWLAPGVAPAIADATSVQIMPLASAALFWVAWRRCRSDQRVGP
jgi:alpha-1,2-mannosyltransferase